MQGHSSESYLAIEDCSLLTLYNNKINVRKLESKSRRKSKNPFPFFPFMNTVGNVKTTALNS